METRKAVVAGRFYKGDKKDLERELSTLFDKTEATHTTNTTRAIVAPHAGYIFSGVVAATAYQQLNPKQKFKNIFILSTSHRLHYSGASIYYTGNYETPLGKIPVNQSITEQLMKKHSFFHFNPQAHEMEHSIEVQLPFLQYCLEEMVPIVPILIGNDKVEDCEAIAQALKPYFTEDNLFIISTDFSHYPPYEVAIEVDTRLGEAIIKNDAATFVQELEDIHAKDYPGLSTAICGWPGMLTLLYLTENDKTLQFKKLLYKNSGDIRFGDKKGVVGYWSMTVESEKL